VKVAIACSGAGQTQRGFERLILDLHGVLKDRIDVTLFKGGGEADDAQDLIWNVGRDHFLHKLLPFHAMTRRTPYHYECLTFAAAAVGRLARGGFDVVHYIDRPMATVLNIGRRLTRASFRTLYTNGAVMNVTYYPRCDHVHQPAKFLMDAALAYGLPSSRMSLVPCGVHAGRYRPRESRSALRRRYGVPEGAFVILSISAINVAQKRLDHVIKEVAALRDDSILWLDGNPEDPRVLELAARELGDRCRVTHVAPGEVVDLYSLADIFVLGSLEESFGIAVVEAMCSGLPVLVHDAPHFEWLLGGRAGLVDMSRRGPLARELSRLQSRSADLVSQGARNTEWAAASYDWANLAQTYVDLYAKVARGG
jgi:glycosyltransferase involved in cell wall biosynthesis